MILLLCAAMAFAKDVSQTTCERVSGTILVFGPARAAWVERANWGVDRMLAPMLVGIGGEGGTAVRTSECEPGEECLRLSVVVDRRVPVTVFSGPRPGVLFWGAVNALTSEDFVLVYPEAIKAFQHGIPLGLSLHRLSSWDVDPWPTMIAEAVLQFCPGAETSAKQMVAAINQLIPSNTDASQAKLRLEDSGFQCTTRAADPGQAKRLADTRSWKDPDSVQVDPGIVLQAHLACVRRYSEPGLVLEWQVFVATETGAVGSLGATVSHLAP